MKSDTNGPITQKRKLEEEPNPDQNEPKRRKMSFDIIRQRFPLVNRMVLYNLDNQSLTKSQEANRGIAEFLDNEKFYWIRIIKKYAGNFEGFEESWKEVIRRTPLDIVKQFALL